MDRTILHSDLNNCYASIELLHRPELRGKPIAVGGNVEARHGIILAKDYITKSFGVKTGEAIWQAKQKCPGLIVVPPNFDLYSRFFRRVRRIYGDYSDRVQPFGMDEAWVALSGTERLHGDGETVANLIRQRVKTELGLTVSIGVSYNKIFAKLGSDYKKPDAITSITKENFKGIVWPLPAGDLLNVGPATQKKLARYGINTIGAIANMAPDGLQNILGTMGLMLHRFANGYDDSPVLPEGEEAIIQSVGNSITAIRDIVSTEDAKIVLLGLSESVAARLRRSGLVSSCVVLSVRDSRLLGYERQVQLDVATDQARELYATALALLQAHHNWGAPVRTLGVRATCLSGANGLQLQCSMFRDDESREKNRRIERTMDQLRSRFGNKSIQRGMMFLDGELSAFDASQHTIHPVGYS